MTIRFIDLPPDIKRFTCECLYSTSSGASLTVEKYELSEAELAKVGPVPKLDAVFSDGAVNMIFSYAAGSGIFERADLARDIPGDDLHDGMTISIEKTPTFFLADGKQFRPGPWA